MKVKEDIRIAKTKSKLVGVFHKLLLEKDFEDITVNEMCDGAGVRRATFYKHFSDKRDFLRYYAYRKRIVFDIRARISKIPADSIDYYLEYPKGILKFIRENDTLIKRVLESSAAATIIDAVKEQNYIDTKERLKMSEERGMTLPISADVLATMLTGAITDTIVKWFKNGRTTPESELVGEISVIVKAILNA